MITAGIYKITSPTNGVYIGQSWELEKRFKKYKYQPDKKQRKIYNSIKKYGWKAHKWEIVHELPSDCTQEIMNTYEILYWQFYKNCGVKVMNIKEPGSRGKHSEESKAIMRAKKQLNNNTGKKLHSEEWKKKVGETMKNNSWAKGYKFTEEQRKRSSQAKIGRIMPKEGVEKSANKRRGVKRSDEMKKKWQKPINQYDMNGNFIKRWDSCKQVEDVLGINGNHIGSVCNRNRKSCHGFIWKHAEIINN